MRTEFFPDGTTMERTTRDWAASILSADGNESAHVDVVNGGYDQKSFLLMAPQHEVIVRQAFEEYRRRVFPFSIREERFREAIGPPPSVIHVFSKVNENLSSIDKLFSSTESWKQTSVQGDESFAESGSKADSSLTPGGAADQPVSTTNDSSSETGGSKISTEQKEMAKSKAPPTSLDSLREQYGLRSTAQTTASTDSNNSATSRLSSMSTSTARFQEIEARIQRQQKEFDRKDRINTERLERMERQFTRFDDMDHRFDTMQGNLMNVMETQAGVGGTMNKLSDKLSALMDMIAITNMNTGQALGISPLLNDTNSTATVANTNQQSFPSPSDSSNRQLDRESFSSPIKKKYRAGFHKDDMEDIGMSHDKDDSNGSADGVYNLQSWSPRLMRCPMIPIWTTCILSPRPYIHHCHQTTTPNLHHQQIWMRSPPTLRVDTKNIALKAEGRDMSFPLDNSELRTISATRNRPREPMFQKILRLPSLLVIAIFPSIHPFPSSNWPFHVHS
ncbi:hypothetical protein MHU86_11275 [Fragilaria crotonensis]|nr:hypothetical protein MHU86_11275 [Fragilaria crotonensis]